MKKKMDSFSTKNAFFFVSYHLANSESYYLFLFLFDSRFQIWRVVGCSSWQVFVPCIFFFQGPVRHSWTHTLANVMILNRVVSKCHSHHCFQEWLKERQTWFLKVNKPNFNCSFIMGEELWYLPTYTCSYLVVLLRCGRIGMMMALCTFYPQHLFLLQLLVCLEVTGSFANLYRYRL